MTTDPSVPRPAGSSTSVPPPVTSSVHPPRPTTQLVSVSSPGAIVGAVLTMALGIALGLANQAAGTTEMGLRVPALLAALLMVGQGVVSLRKSLPQRQEIEVIPDPESGPRGRELAVVRPIAQRQHPVTPVAVRPTPATLSVPITVLLLAAWLGLADLRVAAPPTLSVLSLVAAFALFALGWGLLPARR
jgi:hypothetical protein